MFKSTVDFKKSRSRPSKRHKFSQASHKKCLRREELKKKIQILEWIILDHYIAMSPEKPSEQMETSHAEIWTKIHFLNPVRQNFCYFLKPVGVLQFVSQ